MKKKIRILPLTLIFVLVIYSLSIAFVALPKRSMSVNEKRVLAEFPQLTADSLKNGDFTTGLDNYLADHFPLRDLFVGINAYANLALGQNGDSGIYKCKNDYLITAPYAYDPMQVKKNIDYVTTISDKVGANPTVMVVPTAGYILDDLLPSNHKTYYDDDVLGKIADSNKGFDFIDLRDDFRSAVSDTDVYYHTDHHLTSRGAMIMYRAYCAKRGITPAEFALSDTVSGFYGTTYSKSGLWLNPSDDIEIWGALSGNTYSVSINDGAGFKDYDSIYFDSHLQETDKYPVFLDGNHGYEIIRNKSVHNGKKLLLIKDSYAHCFATYLIENYEEIHMVDPRYYHSSVTTITEDNDFDDLLFLFGAENFATTGDMFWLTR